MTDRPVWERDGRDWPNREASRFVLSGGLRWHVQVMGSGPPLLLVHGTAAATHSWRDLAPLLAARFTVVAPDLPGHGFTGTPPSQLLTLPGMASALAGLMDQLQVRPVLAAGHSAGAAVLLRMCLDGRIAPEQVVSLNGALLPFRQSQSDFFSGMARLLAGLPFIPAIFAWRAQNRAVADRLLRDTGSSVDARGVELYARMFRHAGHLQAALRMMANWELHPLLRDLPRLRAALLLVVGTGDRAIPAAQAERVRQILPAARILRLPGLGHLAHEERPAEVARVILGLSATSGI